MRNSNSPTWRRLILRGALGLVLFSTLSASSRLLAQSTCEAVFQNRTLSAGETIAALQKAGRALTPVNATAEAGQHLMYGFESEYTPDESAKFLRLYAPIGQDQAKWLGQSDAERIEWLKSAVKRKALGNKYSGLTKITTDPALAFFPQQPIIDDTGNLEIVIGPIDDFAAWKNSVQKINQTLGIGSQQSMTSTPRELLFPKNMEKQSNFEEVVGTFNFLHELDTLGRMNEGALRYHPGGVGQVLKTFAHPYLGPMTLAKQTYMKAQLQNLANGQATHFDSVYVTSSKYVGSTTPRPDIGMNVGRMGAEVRDAHNNEAKLIEKTERISVLFMANRSRFKAFSKIEAVDTKIDFEKFSPESRAALEVLFPSRRDQTFGAAHEVFALDVFRNFSYPLKNWAPDLVAMGREDLTEQVRGAQKTYLTEIQKITEAFQAGKLSETQARAQVQGRCAQFSSDSGLYAAFHTVYNTLMDEMGREILKNKLAQK